MTSSCSRTWVASGWAKMVRIAAATISALPLGTWASTLRRKWTSASLPTRAEQHGGDGLFEAGVGVGDDQLHPTEAAGLQRA